MTESRKFSDILLSAAGGAELLINLVEGLEDGSVTSDKFALFVSEAERRVKTPLSDDPVSQARIRYELMDIVFKPPIGGNGEAESLNYISKLPAESVPRIASFVTWQKLINLIPEGTELDELISDIVGLDYRIMSDSRPAFSDEMEAVAEAVNELAPTTPNFLVSGTSEEGEPFPFWATFNADIDELKKAGEPRLANRIRDFLGLGHMKRDVPIFGFYSNVPLGPTYELRDLARPTIFDGIDNSYFKHRLGKSCRSGWGRALDLFAAQNEGGDYDGGPEAITPGVMFGDRFVCSFIGFTDTAPMPAHPKVLEVLLEQATAPLDSIEAFETKLRERLET